MRENAKSMRVARNTKVAANMKKATNAKVITKAASISTKDASTVTNKKSNFNYIEIWQKKSL